MLQLKHLITSLLHPPLVRPCPQALALAILVVLPANKSHSHQQTRLAKRQHYEEITNEFDIKQEEKQEERTASRQQINRKRTERNREQITQRSNRKAHKGLFILHWFFLSLHIQFGPTSTHMQVIQDCNSSQISMAFDHQYHQSIT